MAKPVTTPFSLRVPQRMLRRLQRLQLADGLAVQEHIRRSVDIYLADREREFHLPPLPMEVGEQENEEFALFEEKREEVRAAAAAAPRPSKAKGGAD